MTSNLGIYVHIPFCVRKCNYCDFLSFSADECVKHQYVNAVRKEMESRKETLKDYVADSVFIGGGTPSILSVSDMDVVFQGLSDCFSLSNDVEFTVECNPGTLDKEKLLFYRQAGVNRISLGMQSTFDEELRQLGRIHNYRQFLDSYEMVRQMGYDNVNVDVMFALPQQTKNSYEITLQRLIDLEPEHISSYSLIIEEGTPFYEKYAAIPPVDEDTDRFMYERTEQILSAAGYQRYEISNYAKKGKECRHNIKYWDRSDYLGMGIGAASLMEDFRFTNVRNLHEYLYITEKNGETTDEKEFLSKEDAKAEFMYLGLRMMKGISINDFELKFQESFHECYGLQISRFAEQGLMACQGDSVFLTGKGIDVSNRIFAEFL